MFNFFFRFELTKYIQRNLKLLLVAFGLTVLIYYAQSSRSSEGSSETEWWMDHGNKVEESGDETRADLQYAVMIDAGSSGSRVYTYAWPPHSGDTRQLLDIRKHSHHSITPGLSSCANNPSDATHYLSPLLNFAAANIPRAKHKETPLYVLATAGMRLLESSIQHQILDNLRNEIPKNYSFLFTANNVAIISGKEEGIYSWIAINYLMGRFDHSLTRAPLVSVEQDQKMIKRRVQTHGMIELGGASLQIAFEITTNGQYQQLKSRFGEDSLSKVISEFNLGCSEHDTDHQYRVFTTTFLTLGANAARKNYVRYLIDSQSRSRSYANSSTSREQILFDPCLSIDSSETINATGPMNQSSVPYLYHLKGSGNFSTCFNNLKQFFLAGKPNWCLNTTCPFDDLKKVVVPFRDTEFYGLSEFWYSMNDIFHMGGQYLYTSFTEASAKYCSTSWLVTQDRFKRKLYPNADFKRLLYQCFKSAWVTAVLHEGFHMPKHYSRFKSVSTVGSEPVQWTLGALILRTRFFPLHGVMIHHVMTSSSQGNLYLQYALFALCMLAVIFSIVVYLCRLHSMLNSGSNKQSYYSTKSANNIEAYPLCEDGHFFEQQDHQVFINFN